MTVSLVPFSVPRACMVPVVVTNGVPHTISAKLYLSSDNAGNSEITTPLPANEGNLNPNSSPQTLSFSFSLVSLGNAAPGVPYYVWVIISVDGTIFSTQLLNPNSQVEFFSVTVGQGTWTA